MPKIDAETQWEMRSHVEEEASFMDVDLVYNQNNPGYYFGLHLIRTPEPRGPISYFTGLHELGHAHHEHSRNGALNSTNLLQEIEAWEWALQVARFEVTASVKNHIRKCLRSYVIGLVGRRALGELEEYFDRLEALGIPQEEVLNEIKSSDLGQFQVGERLVINDVVNPTYLRGQEVEVEKVARKKLHVRLITCEAGRRIKAGTKLAIYPNLLERI